MQRILITLAVCIASVWSQIYRQFPPLSNLARHQPISSQPNDSSCGIPARSSFCRSSTFVESITECISDYCDQSCPLRYELPPYDDLLDASFTDGCLSRDTINKATDATQFSILFSGGRCIYSTRSLSDTAELIALRQCFTYRTIMLSRV